MPIERPGQPGDIGSAWVLLAGENSASRTGDAIPVDGGLAV